MKEEKKKKAIPKKTMNRAKIIKEIAKDPFLTQREIAKRTGLGKTTVQEHLQEIPQATKSDQIDKIIKKDIAIVEKVLKVIEGRVSNADGKGDERVSTRDLISIADTSAKRYSLFAGDATDNKGGLKIEALQGAKREELEMMSIEELEDMMRSLISTSADDNEATTEE